MLILASYSLYFIPLAVTPYSKNTNATQNEIILKRLIMYDIYDNLVHAYLGTCIVLPEQRV
jgi:hypothetical protein